VHSGPGDAINIGIVRPGSRNKIALTACTPVFCHLVSPAKGVSFVVSFHVVVGPGWCAGGMDVASHGEAHHCRLYAAEFLDGDRQKDRRPAGRCRCWPHCLVHLAVSLLLIVVVAPRFWFVAFIDFAIHITVDRLKGIARRRSA